MKKFYYRYKERHQPKIYVLRLEGDNYYVGITINLRQRLKKHIKGKGSKWTAKHKFVELVETRLDGTTETENSTTVEYIDKFGWEKVRGGYFIALDPKHPDESIFKIRAKYVDHIELDPFPHFLTLIDAENL
ncbi:hypothetical protein BNJ_00463 [Kaumoebavirus]|uniref:hypothetical protein n=1 Tax=Kaumoebavirus TaxID=1859492 RepID=UPI0009C1F712|nr:hypothetical protein BNJ_00463 [Kaumoebavirus]ARA72275.1 hypothetical protein BNJ_00463 [Kaumoebavirus]